MLHEQNTSGVEEQRAYSSYSIYPELSDALASPLHSPSDFTAGTLFREVCYRVTGSHKQLLSFDVAVEAERAQDKSFANLVDFFSTEIQVKSRTATLVEWEIEEPPRRMESQRDSFES
ncbi:Olfactory Receptor 13C2 [Manis pentadactyla]|nr:Olfactory Receptor 13C2 [Manis pentadactyla]